jgi:tetratricopeptide (TPR) repeat protein
VPMLERSIALRRTAEALSNLGTTYFQLKRYADAAKILDEAVQVDEHNYEVWGNLGDAYYWAPGLREKAGSAYERASSLAQAALGVNPRDANALGYLAEYQAMLGKREEAMKNLEKCLRLNPGDPNLMMNAAIVYNKFGKEEKALGWMEKAVAGGLPRSFLRESPNFDNLHDTLQFKQLTKGEGK